MKGFDYRTHEKVDRSVKEWQELLTQAIKSGGRRRVEHGETFIHGPDALIIAEVYGYLPKTDLDKDGHEVTCI